MWSPTVQKHVLLCLVQDCDKYHKNIHFHTHMCLLWLWFFIDHIKYYYKLWQPQKSLIKNSIILGGQQCVNALILMQVFALLFFQHYCSTNCTVIPTIWCYRMQNQCFVFMLQHRTQRCHSDTLVNNICTTWE